LFGVRLGLSVDSVALIMAAAFAGGMLLEWPTGYLSDRFDRRSVLVALGATHAVLAAGILLIGDRGLWPLIVLFALFGGVTFALYPMSLAHAADRMKEGDDMVPVATGLLMVFGVGAALGPTLAGLMFGMFDGRGLFVFMVLVGLGLSLFGLWRGTKKAAPSQEAQTPYTAIVEVETTPAIYQLASEARPAQLELEFPATVVPSDPDRHSTN
jgi:MFS family permease